MNPPPLVSVIIPVHNGAPFLLDTLHSVYKQEYPNLEILAINHGSTDQSEEILASQTKVRTITQPHLGNAHARNTGIRHAGGDYLAFLDQDDLWDPSKIRKHMEILLVDPSILYTVSHFQFFLSPGSICPSWCRQEPFTIGKPDFSPSSLVAKKEAFRVNGLFDENLRTASDMEWFFQANDKKLPMKILPEILHRRRIHEGNQSQHAAPIKKEMLSVIRNTINRKKTLTLHER